jgi:septum formation protein
VLDGESPEGHVRRLAVEKAAAVSSNYPDEIVLGADTIVLAPDGTILGKPVDLPDARRMLVSLSGCHHSVLTGVCLMRCASGQSESWVCTTDVLFKGYGGEVVERYLGLVNTLDKAGSYAIQEHGDMLVDSIRGLRSNVVGLPVEEVMSRLAAWDAGVLE